MSKVTEDADGLADDEDWKMDFDEEFAFLVWSVVERIRCSTRPQIFYPQEVCDLQLDEGLSLPAACRVYRKLSQAELAAAADVDLPELQAFESGEREPSREVVERLAKALDCHPGHLVDDEEVV